MTVKYIQETIKECEEELAEKQNETLLIQRHELDPLLEEIGDLKLELRKYTKARG